MPAPSRIVGIHYKKSSGNSINVAEQEGKGNKATWINQAYRTITFDEEPTGDLLAWLQVNAVKQ